MLMSMVNLSKKRSNDVHSLATKKAEAEGFCLDSNFHSGRLRNFSDILLAMSNYGCQSSFRGVFQVVAW